MTIIIGIALIFLLAGFIQGVSGFGSALVAIPLLVYFIDIKEAVPLCILSSIFITTYLVYQLRSHLDKKKILPLCLGSIPGICIGATLLKTVPSSTIRLILGVLLALYATYSLLCSPKPRKLNKMWGYLAGFMSGSIGAAFSAGGPPSIIYATLSDWDKHTIKATLTGFFFFNSLLVAAAHAVTGMTTVSVMYHLLIAAPAVLIGTALGSFCYSFFRRDVYLRIIFLFLIFMGLMMVFGR